MTQFADTSPRRRAAIELTERFVSEPLDALLPKGHVQDRLLDLRNAVVDHDELVAAVDEVLSAIPGRHLTPGGWWRHEAGSLRLLVAAWLSEDEDPAQRPKEDRHAC